MVDEVKTGGDGAGAGAGVGAGAGAPDAGAKLAASQGVTAQGVETVNADAGGAKQPDAGAAKPLSVSIPPKDAKPEEWDNFYKAVGRPDTPEGYEIKLPEGADPTFMKTMTAAAHKAGLAKSQLGTLNAALDEFNAQAVKAREVANDQAYETATATLKREWGNAFPDRLAETQNGMKANFSPAVMQQIVAAGLDNNAEFIMGLNKLVRAGGEDALGPVTPRKGALTPSDAQREIDRMALDPETQKALFDPNHPGHDAVIRKRAQLYEAMYGESGTITKMTAQPGVNTPRVIIVGTPNN